MAALGAARMLRVHGRVGKNPKWESTHTGPVPVGKKGAGKVAMAQTTIDYACVSEGLLPHTTASIRQMVSGRGKQGGLVKGHHLLDTKVQVSGVVPSQPAALNQADRYIPDVGKLHGKEGIDTARNLRMPWNSKRQLLRLVAVAKVAKVAVGGRPLLRHRPLRHSNPSAVALLP